MQDRFDSLDPEIKKYLLLYNTGRIDIKNTGSEDNKVLLIENNDPLATVVVPKWFEAYDGEGLSISSINNHLKLKLKCINDGLLKISLKGPNFKDKDKNRFHVFIDFEQFKVNGVNCLKNNVAVHHNKPFLFEMDVKDLDEIDVEIKWKPFNRFSTLEESFPATTTNLDYICSQLKKHEMYIDAYNKYFNTLFVDYVHKPSDFLDVYFKLSYELLSFLENICNSHNLEFWLSGGTLLGAIRHNDFIPWDDDLDVAMIRKDYIKLNNLLKDEIDHYNLSDILNFQHRTRRIDNKEIQTFIQLFVKQNVGGKKTSIMAGLDIFPWDYLVDYDERTIEQVYYESKLSYYRNLSDNNKDSLEILYDDLNLSKEKAKYIIPGVEGAFGPHNMYKLLVLESNQVFPLTKATFGEKTFNVPNDYHNYLKSIYKDYMFVPKNIRIHNRVNNFKYMQNRYSIFNESLKRLKEVNSTF